MDCNKALEFLDCVRPNSDDLESPEFSEARTHMESCESCQQEFATRQEFDLAIAAVVRDVEVPESLKASLLSAALAEAGEGEVATPQVESDVAQDTSGERELTAAEDEETPTRRKSRRMVLLAGAAIACGILLAVIVQFMPSGPKQFTVAELLDEVRLNWDTLKTFDDDRTFDESFKFHLPSGWGQQTYWDTIGGLEPFVGGLNLDGDGDESSHDLAVVVFRHEMGFIVAVPISRMGEIPPSVSEAEVQYLPKQRAVLVWTERDMVYVVAVYNNDVRQLERLREVLTGRAA